MRILRFQFGDSIKTSLFSNPCRSFASNSIRNPNLLLRHSSRDDHRRFSRFFDNNQNQNQNQRFNKPSHCSISERNRYSSSSLHKKSLNPNPNPHFAKAASVLSATLFRFRVLARIVVPEHLTSTRKTMEVFESWMSEYNKNYSSMEEKLHRFEIFRYNLKFIDETNKKISFQLGLNQFADLSHEEFKSSYCSGLNVEFPRNKSTEFRYRDVKDLPESVDWRSKGAVTSVKNQGDCSASWAFSAVASVEGINQIVTGNLIDLSVQELIDCDIFNNGCNGGLMHNAFQYIMSSDGLRKEMDYPYLMKKGLCKGNKREFEVVTISGYEEVPRNDEQSLLKAISCQPVSVAVDFSDLAFQFYKGGVCKGGVFKVEHPSLSNLNHAVTAVGYGSSEGEDYIILKNSWGVKWGEEGYMRILRNSTSGINLLASYPTKQK